MTDLDEFEIAARTWAAQQKGVEHSRAISRVLGLGPALVGELESAYLADDSERARSAEAAMLCAVADKLEELDISS